MKTEFAFQLPIKTMDLGTMVFMTVMCLLSVNTSYGQQPSFSACFLDLDMPLSQGTPDQHSSLQGLYVDLGEMMAARMEKKFEPFFTMAAFHKRPLRAGLLADKCQVHFGVPNTEGPEYIAQKVVLTNPILNLGYALVFEKSEEITTYLNLKGKTVGVQTGSPPQMAIAIMENIEMEYYSSAEQALEALAQGLLDVAFIWGPTAGYQNKYIYQDRFAVIPTSYEWPVSIGVHYKDKELLQEINNLIDDLQDQISDLENKYAFPQGQKLTMPKFPYDF